MKKISELTEATAVQDGDYLVVNTSGGTQKTKVNTVRLPVVNGFTTTTSGSVLDARAGKTLKDEVNTVTSQVSTLQTGMAGKLDSGMFKIVQFNAPGSNISANGRLDVSYTVSQADYTCLGMIGFNTGEYDVFLVTCLYTMGASTLTMRLKNTGSAKTINPQVTMLYVKTTV